MNWLFLCAWLNFLSLIHPLMVCRFLQRLSLKKPFTGLSIWNQLKLFVMIVNLLSFKLNLFLQAINLFNFLLNSYLLLQNLWRDLCWVRLKPINIFLFDRVRFDHKLDHLFHFIDQIRFLLFYIFIMSLKIIEVSLDRVIIGHIFKKDILEWAIWLPKRLCWDNRDEKK